MLLEPRHNHCIWCDQPFAVAGFKQRPGEVIRHEEHIIPRNIFGRLKTLDVCKDCNGNVCKDCNGKLGSDVDARLLQDADIFNAGLQAGFKGTELVSELRVSGITSSGEPYEHQFKDKRWCVVPKFTATGFKIGSIDGFLPPSYLEAAKGFMVKQAQRSGASSFEARERVERLFRQLAAKGYSGKVFDTRLNAGISGHCRETPGPGLRRMTTHHWQTEWAIAKMAYESAVVFWSCDGLRRLRSSLDQLRRFVLEKPERQMFDRRTLNEPAEARHEIEIDVSGTEIVFQVRIFGREEWRLSFQIHGARWLPPVPVSHLLVLNFCLGSAVPTVRILENGQDVRSG